MHTTKPRRHLTTKPRREMLGLLVLLSVFGAAHCYAQPAAVEPPDAVIELWEQHWTLNADGSTVYHEKKHVQLNNERAYGEFADPRITHRADLEQLEVLVARTKLADGRYLDLPDYAWNEVGPDPSAGWPAYANLWQGLLVMSGIEPGCVVELEYRLTSQPGTRPYLAADLRVDHRYPIRKRVITVQVPSDVGLKVATANLPERGTQMAAGSWTFTDLPAAADEPQAPPWQTRRPRLTFSTAGLASDWLRHWTSQMEAAADQSDLIAKLASEWTKDQHTPSDKLRALQEKLAASFNFVDFPVAWWPATLRPASEVLRDNYGLPAEAAAALLALGRALDLPVVPGILVDDDIWNREVPQDGMVSAFVVLLVPKPGGVRAVGGESPGDGHPIVTDTGEPPEIWEPRRGKIVREGRWAGHMLLPVPDLLMPKMSLPAWTSADESRCRVHGKLTLSDDGSLVGTLTLRATGLFATSESLRSADAQKARMGALLGHVVPALNVESLVVKTLAAAEFEATAQVKSGAPLKKLNDRFTMRLAQDGPFLADVPLPLAVSRREQAVRLTGPFEEEITITLEWPEKWKLEITPDELAASSGNWGSVEQAVTRGEHSLTLTRRTRVTQGTLAAADFAALRAALNELRSEYARTLVLKP